MLKIIIKYLHTLIKPKYNIKIYFGGNISRDVLEEIFRFRYRVYCLVDKLLKKENYPNGLESDLYDNFSDFIVAYSKGRIVGLMRVIKFKEEGLPTIEEFNLQEKIKNYNRKEVVELSRLMIAPEYRNTLLLYDLYSAAYSYSKKRNIKYWIGCVEKWLLKSIKGVIGEIEILGKETFCFNAINYPFIINLNVLEKRIKEKNKFFYLIFKHKIKKIKINF